MTWIGIHCFSLAIRLHKNIKVLFSCAVQLCCSLFCSLLFDDNTHKSRQIFWFRSKCLWLHLRNECLSTNRGQLYCHINVWLIWHRHPIELIGFGTNQSYNHMFDSIIYCLNKTPKNSLTSYIIVICIAIKRTNIVHNLSYRFI